MRERRRPGSGSGNRGQQRDGVGMARGGEQRLGRPRLDDAAQVHHGHPVRDLPDHREVVRDEEVGEPAIALQVGEQVEHLRLDRHVERRDRLVADDEARARPRAPARCRCAAAARRRTRAGSAARMPDRARPPRAARRPDGRTSGPGAPGGGSRCPSAIAAPTVIRGLRQPYGILEDDLHPAAKRARSAARSSPKTSAPVEPRLSRGRLLQPQDRAADGGLAAPALAHQRQRLAPPDLERDAVHRADRRRAAARRGRSAV